MKNNQRCYIVNKHGFFSSYAILILCICVSFCTFTIQKALSVQTYHENKMIQYCELYAIKYVNELLQSVDDITEEEKKEEESLFLEDEKNHSLHFRGCEIEVTKANDYFIKINNDTEILHMKIIVDEDIKNIMNIVYE